MIWKFLRIWGLFFLFSGAMLTFYFFSGKNLAESATDGIRGMIRVPAGPFLMGSTPEDVSWAVQTFFAESEEWYHDETPGQAIHLNEFFIDRHEVSVDQYLGYLDSTKRQPPKYFDDPKFNQPEQPVVGVTWQQASDSCAWQRKRV